MRLTLQIRHTALIAIIIFVHYFSDAQSITDNRKDWYEIKDVPAYNRASASVFHSTSSGLLTPDFPNGYLFSVEPWRYRFQNTTGTICTDNRFYGQLISSPLTGSTGILVGQNIVVVPRHAFNGGSTPQAMCEGNGRAFIFDYRQDDFNDPPVNNGAVTEIPFLYSQVYFCDSVLGYSDQGDWVVIRLDRPVPQKRIPLKVQRLGTVFPGDSMVMIGHHNRLPLKIEECEVRTPGPYLTVTGMVRVGSSGSAIINKRTGKLEGMVVAGATLGFIQHIDQFGDTCYSDDFGNTAIFGAAKTASTFQQAVPPIGLQWQQTHKEISHFGPPGGPFTNNTVFNYGIYVPTDEIRPVPVLYLESDPDGLLYFPPITVPDTMWAGQSLSINNVVLTNTVNSLGQGFYRPSLRVGDGAYHTVEEATHLVYVGVGGYELICEAPNHNCALSFKGNYIDTFYIANKYLVEQQIEAFPTESWVQVNGSNVPDTLYIAAGDTAMLVVSYDTIGLPNGQYPEANVNLQALFNGQRSQEIIQIPLRGFSLNPDLIPSNLENHPIRSVYGTYLVSAYVVNSGTRDADSSVLRISRQDMFSNPLVQASPVTLADVDIPPLAAGKSYYVEHSFFYINGLADQIDVLFEADLKEDVTEISEANNLQRLPILGGRTQPELKKGDLVIQEKHAFSVYPNPFGNQFTVSGGDDGLSEPNLSLLDATGRQVWSLRWFSWPTSMDVTAAGLPNGIYFLVLEDYGRIMQVSKLVKSE